MKTITFKSNNASIYLFDDGKFVDIQNDKTVVGNPVEYLIADCTQQTAEIYENVIAPADWCGHKYLFDGTTWTPNPDYQEPTKPE
jgi:hypothetical protein